ncbi:CAF17-like 4Fe-4S cluster assembly/insertion protein YgfZ [Halocalculus aciditolerans]|uniref:Glycine cleavage system protein T n=1 Tax=Halocalculus aciditolerans TaxID=1383812 RepID=A0A830F751_9EURY|nr:aminomethyl transferase family protein [Halocalculus aciditolerans]GGL69830.1 glycine cleavage system protein T [Halocalculus aciditolerans]
MTLIRDTHADYGASFETVGGREYPAEYGRSNRAHRAVRNVVGVTETPYGVVTVSGDDRHEFVNDAVTNEVPTEDGAGCRCFLLDPQGGIEYELTVWVTADSLLVFTPPGRASDLAGEWSEKVFIQDVSVEAATEQFGTFGVHGPKATEKVASVLHGATAPEDAFTFVRGRTADIGVNVARLDDPTGDEGYEVFCAAADAEPVFSTLVTNGLNATPFGRTVYEALTLEAGTPLFDTELEGKIPNVAGQDAAVDYEKGCFVGQEVVSRVHNRGRPSERLVGVSFERDSDVAPGPLDDTNGEITRVADSPMRDATLAFAYVPFTFEDPYVTRDGETGAIEKLPFVETESRSGRTPQYD